MNKNTFSDSKGLMQSPSTLLLKLKEYGFLNSQGNVRVLTMNPRFIKTHASTTMRKINLASMQFLQESVRAYGWNEVFILGQNS